MIYRLLLSIAIASSVPFASHAQEVGDAEAGVVYFYFTAYTLPRGIVIGTPNISLYCNGRIVGKVKKGSFLGVRVPPGRHTFASKGVRTRLEETAIELDVKPGEITFVRLEVGIGNLKWWAHLRVVGRDEGSLMISKLDPVPEGLVKDRSRATIARPTPAELASTAPEPPLTNADVIALRRAGIDDDVLCLKIRQSPGAYDLSPAGTDALRREGISDAVVAAMTASVQRTSGRQER
jgi:hypothetical protein